MQSTHVHRCIGKLNMADRQAVVSTLIGLISSLITYVQLNIAMLSFQVDYARKRTNIIRLLSLTVSKIGTVKRLNRRSEARSRRFWVRPGRTSAWWASFVNQIVVSKEWRENFRMSWVSLYTSAEELRPYIVDRCDSVPFARGLSKACTVCFFCADKVKLSCSKIYVFHVRILRTFTSVIREAIQWITCYIILKFIQLPEV